MCIDYETEKAAKAHKGCRAIDRYRYKAKGKERER
jgi:hypothetical protein